MDEIEAKLEEMERGKISKQETEIKAEVKNEVEEVKQE